MRVNKAKRKLLRWERYMSRYRQLAVPRGMYYNGHAVAFYNYANANRWVPKGIRDVGRAKWMY